MQYGRKAKFRILCKILCMSFVVLCAVIPGAAVHAAGTDRVTAQIPVSCTGQNTTERFLYRLEGIQSDTEGADRTEFYLKDGEKGTFSITYQVPGTYHYTITQNKGTDKKTTYDDTIYQADVWVYWENDRLKADVIVYVKGETQKRAEAAFYNEKEVPKETEATNGNGTNKPTHSSGGSQSSTSYSGNVKTGDETPLAALLGMMLVSTGLVLIILGKRRRRENA